MKKNKGNTSVGIELDRQAYHKREATKVITDYSRMLESPKERHKVSMMKELNWDQSVSRVQAEKGEELERSSVADSLRAPVSKRDEIRQIAVDYDLKFLPAYQFRCPEKREYELTTMLSDFMEERGIDNNAFSKNNFFILADEKYFINHQIDIDDEVGAFVFYVPPKQRDNFVRVNNIGNGELTFKRYMRGWRRKEAVNTIIHSFVVAFAISLPLFGLITGGRLFESALCSILMSVTAVAIMLRLQRDRGGVTHETWDKMRNDD